MMTKDQLMAEALVEQGYAEKFDRGRLFVPIDYMAKGNTYTTRVDPFSDTLKGYRQRDYLLNYLMLKHESKYFRVRNLAYARYDTIQEQDKFTITECFEQLAGESDD